MNLKAFARRHPLRCYFGLAYAITWGGILALVVSKGFHLAEFQTWEVLFIFLMMLLGPSTSSLVWTTLLAGRSGLQALWRGWRPGGFGLGWLALAALTVPVLFGAILALLKAMVSPAYTPGFQGAGLGIGLLAGACEELGWTGFATPRLLHKFNPIRAGFILGLVWAVWHVAADFSANIGSMGINWVVWFGLYWILPLTAYRILMTWAYAHTRSLLLGQLMHVSYTGWLFVLAPAASFEQNLVWQALFAAGLWLGVAILAWASRYETTGLSNLAKRPL